ncbi:MAG: NAD(P)-dependent alcohol dehydrogenase [Gammaproteobacteria bacterium]|nr:NAD(P)-dependent alcohol dehydrogenase [Gammaproteobacteria bacterium]
MRHVQLSAAGLKHLALVSGGTPDPGPGEVRVRMHSAAVNYRDYMICAGFYGGEKEYPLIPLSDGAGVVESIGSEVTQYRPGDRVMTVFWQDWEARPVRPGVRTRSTGCEAPGALAEIGVFPENALLPVPDGMAMETAAALGCAGVAAWTALRCGGPVGPDSKVLLLGTGGVSIFALQIAKSMGATTVITSSSDEKLERARALGADETINYANTPEWGLEVFELAGGGVDVVVETGGMGTLGQSLQALGLNGSIGMLVALGGITAEINPMALIGKCASIHGITVGAREDHAALSKHLAQHGVAAVIDRVFPLDQGPEAIRAIARGDHFGKLLVSIA